MLFTSKFDPNIRMLLQKLTLTTPGYIFSVFCQVLVSQCELFSSVSCSDLTDGAPVSSSAAKPDSASSMPFYTPL